MNVRDLIERYNAAWNAQDLDTIHGLHHPDIVFDNHTAADQQHERGEPEQHDRAPDPGVRKVAA